MMMSIIYEFPFFPFHFCNHFCVSYMQFKSFREENYTFDLNN